MVSSFIAAVTLVGTGVKAEVVQCESIHPRSVTAAPALRVVAVVPEPGCLDSKAGSHLGRVAEPAQAEKNKILQ